ncbi:hypothetical protein C8Q73DRAFT_117969 [Cubamyces lactineus]|nr:hypothetical protein C8Q73DRAFT_117969 [Cubamyces lactineus]
MSLPTLGLFSALCLTDNLQEQISRCIASPSVSEPKHSAIHDIYGAEKQQHFGDLKAQTPGSSRLADLGRPEYEEPSDVYQPRTAHENQRLQSGPGFSTKAPATNDSQQPHHSRPRRRRVNVPQYKTGDSVLYYSHKSAMWLKGEIASLRAFPARRGEFTDEDGFEVWCYPVLIKIQPRLMQYKPSTEILPC